MKLFEKLSFKKMKKLENGKKKKKIALCIQKKDVSRFFS